MVDDPDQRPDCIAMRYELRRLVEARIDTLPEVFRTVFMLRAVEDLKPSLVVLDPITNFIAGGTQTQVKAMLMRLIDTLKGRQISGFFTSLTGGEVDPEQTEAGVSSLMDTWILVAVDTVGNQRQRKMYVLKSRGMAHSDEVRNFRFTSQGIQLLPSTTRERRPRRVARRSK